MASGYVAGGELCIGMEFSDKEAVVRAIKDYSISKLVDYKMFKLELTTFVVSANTSAKGTNGFLESVSEKRRMFRKLENIMAYTLALQCDLSRPLEVGY